MKAVSERGELGLLPSVGEAEAAAHLAITRRKRDVGAELQAGITVEPRGLELFKKSGVAGRDRELEVVALGEEFGEGLLAKTGDNLGRRLVAGQKALRQIEGQPGKRIAELGEDLGFEFGNFLEDTVAERLHVGPKLNHLLVGQGAGGIDAAAVTLLGVGGEFGLGVKAAAGSGQNGPGERSVEGDEFGEGHGRDSELVG